jgi:hypothetical protein
MGWANKLIGWATGNGVEVDVTNRLKVNLEPNAIANALQIGGVRMFSELDQGYQTGVAVLASPEVDVDYRLRASMDTLLDEEVFNYTAQNTGKHQSVSTTMAATWTAGQFTTNSGSITTTTTGYYLKTYASFPNVGTSTLSADFEASFSAQPSANNFVEFGLAPDITSATAAPGDGVFFRLTSAGLRGVVSFNGSETPTGVFTGVDGVGTWAYTNSKRHQFIVYIGAVSAQFWVNDGVNVVLLGRIALPAGTGRVAMGAGMRAFFGQRITGGAAGAVLQANLNAYSVRIGGAAIAPHNFGNRIYGSYQGLGGGTMGSLANYANSANPTAGVPTNATAALGTGLGGQFWETATLAVNTDGIICSYQVPTPTVNVQGRRLVLKRVKIDSYIKTDLTGGGWNEQWTLAFGHTAVSLATGEATNTKAPRRVVLGTRSVAAAAAALTQLTTIELDLSAAPVYVNPGEFVAVVKKHVGTAATAGTIGHTIAMVYDWE